MTCELNDCIRWANKDQGCHGRAFWPLFGNIGGLSSEINTIAHRCCGYQPRGTSYEEKHNWTWPVPEESYFSPGCPEAVKMWFDAGLPEDFRLPGQEEV